MITRNQEKEETTPPTGRESLPSVEKTPTGTRRAVDKEATPNEGDMGKREISLYSSATEYNKTKAENRRG